MSVTWMTTGSINRYMFTASYDKLYFPSQIMWEHSLIFWNFASSWLTHTVFSPMWTLSSFIIKVCVILKNIFASFPCVGCVDMTNNQWLKWTHNYNCSLLVILFKSIQVNKGPDILPAQSSQLDLQQKSTSSVTWINVVSMWPRSHNCIPLTSDSYPR